MRSCRARRASRSASAACSTPWSRSRARRPKERGGPRYAIDLPTAGDRTTDPLTIQGLEGRLGQVFRNLLSNAATFSPADGTIRVAARRADGWVQVKVDDDGPGIPENKLPRSSTASTASGRRMRNSAPTPASVCRSPSRSWRPTAAASQPRTGATRRVGSRARASPSGCLRIRAKCLKADAAFRHFAGGLKASKIQLKVGSTFQHIALIAAAGGRDGQTLIKC